MSGSVSLSKYTGPIDEEEEIEVDDDGEDKNRPLIDSEWYEKLKCIDDSHSAVYGLTKRNFDLLMKNLERKVGTTDKERVDTICETKEVSFVVKNTITVSHCIFSVGTVLQSCEMPHRMPRKSE